MSSSNNENYVRVSVSNSKITLLDSKETNKLWDKICFIVNDKEIVTPLKYERNHQYYFDELYGIFPIDDRKNYYPTGNQTGYIGPCGIPAFATEEQIKQIRENHKKKEDFLNMLRSNKGDPILIPRPENETVLPKIITDSNGNYIGMQNISQNVNLTEIQIFNPFTQKWIQSTRGSEENTLQQIIKDFMQI
jgi:hypothetical protein